MPPPASIEAIADTDYQSIHIQSNNNSTLYNTTYCHIFCGFASVGRRGQQLQPTKNVSVDKRRT
jgi:hypothetical protein